LQGDVRKLQDLEIASEILQDTTTMRNLRSVEKARDAIAAGKSDLALSYLEQAIGELSPEAAQGVTEAILKMKSGVSPTEAIDEAITAIFDGIFKKYKIPQKVRQSYIKSYLSGLNVATQVPA